MDEYTRHVEVLNSSFNNNFFGVYKKASVSKRRRLIPQIHNIYRRWYYAALVEGTPLSPVNILASINGYHELEPDTHAVPVPKTPSKLVGISAKTLKYSIDEHPIIGDIGEVIKYSQPYIDIHEKDFLTEEQAHELASLLSIQDPYYAAFLFDISMRLGFIEKVPSLYMNRLNPTPKYDEFLKQKPREMLWQLLGGAILFCSYGLHTALQMPSAPFTYEFILEILKNPMSTDDIIQRVFESIGVDIAQVMNRDIFDEEFRESEDFEEIDGLLHSMYVVGLALDKYLHTPFGHFFRIISPVYSQPFDFEQEMMSFLDSPNDPQETFFSFFLPPDSYRLTEFGENLLEVPKTSAKNPFVVQFELLKDSAFRDENSFRQYMDVAGQVFPYLIEKLMKGDIYKFKVKASYKPTLWAHIQISENSSLHELYAFIAELFLLRDNNEYSFFHDKTENLFAEYPSAKRSGRLRAPRDNAETVLAELNFEHMNHMVLTAYNQSLPFTKDVPTKRFALEFMGVSQHYFDEEYPRVSRHSKALAELGKNS